PGCCSYRCAETEHPVADHPTGREAGHQQVARGYSRILDSVDGTFTTGSLPLHVTHHRISRCWLAASSVAIIGLCCTANSADAPPLLVPEQITSSEIQLALQKLNVLGRVLYIAAHPDDENTNLMALWTNGSLYDSAYLSIT